VGTRRLIEAIALFLLALTLLILATSA